MIAIAEVLQTGLISALFVFHIFIAKENIYRHFIGIRDFFQILLEHVAILFEGPPMRKACWSGMS